MNDDDFVRYAADTLAAVPTVKAVTLGGSRAQGTARADSDWDIGIYYRGDFDPQAVRDIGWHGEVSDVGGWGGGVFNGGAWLHIDGRKVDVHYRDLDVVEAIAEQAQRGDFGIEPLIFHLAGIPTYLLLAELATGQVLRGSPPTINEYPQKLRHSATERWRAMGDLSLSYAENNHAPFGRYAQCLGLVVVAASQYAHAVLASRGIWITNEKRLLLAAGLDPVNEIVAGASDQAPALIEAINRTRDLAYRMLPSG